MRSQETKICYRVAGKHATKEYYEEVKAQIGRGLYKDQEMEIKAMECVKRWVVVEYMEWTGDDNQKHHTWRTIKTYKTKGAAERAIEKNPHRGYKVKEAWERLEGGFYERIETGRYYSAIRSAIYKTLHI